jgi:hypothetical protein
MQNNKQRPRHGAEREETLCEVRDSLFDDVVNDTACMAFIGLIIIV